MRRLKNNASQSRDTVVFRDKFTIHSIASRDGTVSIYANRRVASTEITESQ